VNTGNKAIQFQQQATERLFSWWKTRRDASDRAPNVELEVLGFNWSWTPKLFCRPKL